MTTGHCQQFWSQLIFSNLGLPCARQQLSTEKWVLQYGILNSNRYNSQLKNVNAIQMMGALWKMVGFYALQLAIRETLRAPHHTLVSFASQKLFVCFSSREIPKKGKWWGWQNIRTFISVIALFFKTHTYIICVISVCVFQNIYELYIGI